MTGLLVLAIGVSVWYGGDEQNHSQITGGLEKGTKLTDFYAFRRRYIIVYLVIMLADWMQGTVRLLFTTMKNIEHHVD